MAYYATATHDKGTIGPNKIMKNNKCMNFIEELIWKTRDKLCKGINITDSPISPIYPKSSTLTNKRLYLNYTFKYGEKRQYSILLYNHQIHKLATYRKSPQVNISENFSQKVKKS